MKGFLFLIIGVHMTDSELLALSQQVGAALRQQNATVTTAESCTGGWIAKVITDIAGSSAWFGRGFVTYSNGAKMELVGVDRETLEVHGAVSEPVVAQMAQGARDAAVATYAIAVSGIAGPEGGSEDNPVGTVWFGFASQNWKPLTCRKHFSGDRDAVRRQATVFALETLWQHFLQKT